MELCIKINLLDLRDISTWSFCQDKIMSTGGEGGMIQQITKYMGEMLVNKRSW